MAVYKNTNLASALSGVEFTPVAEGNFTFFYVDSPLKKDGVKAWLTSPEMGQDVIAEAQVKGHPVFITHGAKTKSEIITALEAHGDKLAFDHKPKPFTEKAWSMGATMALVGQLLQLTSSFLRPNRKADWSLRMLAIPNLVATAWILGYGAQRSPDTHRLNYLKEQFNTNVEPYASEVPGLNENRLEYRKDIKPLSVKEKIDNFLKTYSVIGGEIILRYTGALSLAFPANKWGKAAGKLQEGAFKEAYELGRNPSDLTHIAGLASLTGKTIALPSKAADPYNPEPKSWLTNLREKFTFRIGGWIETAAFAALAVDGFKTKKISFTKGGKEYRDFLSGVGGSLFAARYIIRNWAPYGVKDMDMDELYAHVTDGLAKTPPEKIPQLMAESAAAIADNFEGKLDYGVVFNQLMNDMYRYHHIALHNADMPEHKMEAEPAFKDLIAAPARSHADEALRRPKPTLGLSA